MTDEELLKAFRGPGLDPGSFRHRDHVRLSWLVLREANLLETLAEFRAGLMKMATRAGRPEAYHETVTWSFLMIISDRMRRLPETDSFGQFEQQNPDLFVWPNGSLGALYSESCLAADEARRSFVLPDQLGAPEAASTTK